MVYISTLRIFFLFIINWKIISAKKDNFKDYEKTALDAHNQYRTKHGADKLTLNEKMNERADKCAKYYADLGTIDHSCPYKDVEGKSGQKYGENLYESTVNKKSDVEIMKAASDWWYAEEKDYNYKLGAAKKDGLEFRHFTQMVWKTGKELGAGLARKGSKAYVVALYNTGNIKKKYIENVFDPLGIGGK